MPNYQATLNERSYPVTSEDLTTLDAHAPAPDELHLIAEGRSHYVELIAIDRAAKTVRLRLDGRVHEVRLRDEVDQLVDRLGLAVTAAAASKDALAPMPGLVLDVLVEAGQDITAGTPLVILEAMKMENVLKAEADGRVVSVEVAKGQAVDKKQLLLTIE